MSDREELKKILISRSILKGDFTLVSGKKSNYYINGKMTTLYSKGLYLAAKLILDNLDPDGHDAFAGPVIGADPIIGALLTLSAERGREKEGYLIRKEAKGHGTNKIIEGNIEKGARRVIVVDVITTGGSLLRAADAVRREGGKIAGISVIVDREEGGYENIKRAGFQLTSIFKVSELL